MSKDQYIYLVLSKTGTFLSKTISRYGDMEYAHASISLDSSLTKMYSFGRIYPRFPFWGGFVKEDIHGGLYHIFLDAECAVLKIPVTQAQYKKIKGELDYFIQYGKRFRYNFIGLFGVSLGFPIERERAYFCSQFVYSVLYHAGIANLRKNPGLITPRDLMLDEKYIIYKGLVSKYTPEVIYYASVDNSRKSNNIRNNKKRLS